jgi:lysophospholipase L1-like esterase
MKKYFIISLGLGLFFWGVSSRGKESTPKNYPTSRDTINLGVSPDTLVNAKGKSVLFIGDSHTTYAHGWQDRLCKRTGMSYLNTAVGGKTTGWMLGVLRTNISSRYDYCIIWGGANDMAGMIKPLDAVRNVQKMVDICNSKGVKAIVMTGFNPRTCVDVSRQSKAWQPYPARYEVFQKMLQDSIRGAQVIKSHFISRKERDCGDFCCHMNASGHVKMADSMISRLNFKTIK